MDQVTKLKISSNWKGNPTSKLFHLYRQSLTQTDCPFAELCPGKACSSHDIPNFEGAMWFAYTTTYFWIWVGKHSQDHVKDVDQLGVFHFMLATCPISIQKLLDLSWSHENWWSCNRLLTCPVPLGAKASEKMPRLTRHTVILGSSV